MNSFYQFTWMSIPQAAANGQIANTKNPGCIVGSAHVKRAIKWRFCLIITQYTLLVDSISTSTL